jgi:hypothetical protein
MLACQREIRSTKVNLSTPPNATKAVVGKSYCSRVQSKLGEITYKDLRQGLWWIVPGSKPKTRAQKWRID